MANWLGDSISIVDAASLSIASTIPFAAGSYPAATALGPDGDVLYVVQEGPDVVTSIDLATQMPTGTPMIVDHDPGGIALGAAGLDAYVTNLTDDSVSHLDLVARTVIGNAIPVGDLPLALLVAGQDTLFANGFDDSLAH